ncbi:hypothetical protein D9V37_17500 [Nocardioides mangrovicus]|uniref:Uncharacterized protein n=1 Tax=Nocardioides mangrovicus TaxID=2478913 RepID=A0A3L8NZ24_9ACTN|nr:hypothetical protein [Nocardioides mangrovicus]RLV47907.1 hypothetical protein D9V37_17500 [Nocardioides mangrovicus]
MTISLIRPMPETDPAFLRFLADRLAEERAAAAERTEPSRGLDFLEELHDRVARGEAPDRMSCDLLVVAYGRHPAFRPEWNRWRV